MSGFPWGPLVAFLLALGLVRVLAAGRMSQLVVDVPNDRSLHVHPTTRAGGVGLMMAFAVSWLIFGGGALTGPVLVALMLAALFLADDIAGLSIRVRLIAQTIAAAAAVVAIAPMPLLLWPVFIVGIVWSINLYNFMDGSHGFAGGMAVAGFSAYALAAAAADLNDIATVAALIAAAAAGFLVWNFDPARIFLGDAGSNALGFLAAVLGGAGWARGAWPFWFPLLVFSPFWIDATVTLLKRWRRGEQLSEAHKSHYYQRVVRMGWSHRRLALVEYAMMAGTAATGLLARNARPLAAINLLLLWGAIYGVIGLIIDKRWSVFEATRRS